jgi:hypothetical protein
MSTHPVILLEPVSHWLDEIIREHGLELYMICVWVSPLLIAWILTGGFWRRPQRPSPPSKPPPVIKAKAPTGVLPPVMNPKTSGTHAATGLPAAARRR